MESSQLDKIRIRKTRALRVRKRVRGTAEKPRLSVTRSGRHVYAQLINDEISHTLASVSTLSKDFQETNYNRKSKEAAKQVGMRIATLAKERGVSTIVFDRGYRKYHGVIAALAEGARAGGLQF